MEILASKFEKGFSRSCAKWCSSFFCSSLGKEKKILCCSRQLSSQLSSSQPSQQRKTGISQCSKSHSCVLRGRRGRWWCEREENVKMFSKKFILTSSLYWPSARREREREMREWERHGAGILRHRLFARRDDAMMVKNMWDTRRTWMGGDGGWLKWVAREMRAARWKFACNFSSKDFNEPSWC